jgi:ferredoxin
MHEKQKKFSKNALRFFARAGVAYATLGMFVNSYYSRSAEWNGNLAVLIKAQFSAVLQGAGVSSVAVLIIIAASLAFGRVFCSALCPMGTAQELFFRVWRSGRARFIFPWRIRYLIPLVTGLAIVILGEPLIIADPISNFGRGMTAIRAVLGGGAVLPVMGLALPFFLIIALSFLRGRRFCDWCPVGLTLGLLSSVAPFGMRISDKCVSCGLCEKKCPANCISSREKKIEHDRCVLCFSCEAVCPGGFASYGATRSSELAQRREFLKVSGARAAAFLSGAVYLAGPSLKILTNRGEDQLTADETEAHAAIGENHILPPGAGNIRRYLSLCIACQACVSACPVGIVKAKNSPHPELDYSGDFCQYNCTECGRVCPTNAIRRLGAEEKRRTRIALSSLMFERCVVATKGQSCGACAEVCPTRSLRMARYAESEIQGLTRPVFDENYCIGCGACLVVCPAEPVAFSVNASPVQTLTAGIRPSDDGEDDLYQLPQLPDAGDFPF